MTSIHLRITLLTDASFQASSATVGPVETLSRVPGAALLGAAARRLYTHVGTDAWDLFHSGRTRFGDGLPEDSGAPAGPALPMPLSLHVPKGKRDRRTSGNEIYLTSYILNFAQMSARDRPLAESLREGYLGAQLQWILPARHVSMRTAIGEGGRAREGLLYQVSALPAGSVFLARIDLDDAIAHRSADLIQAFDGVELELGRSRSAELGRARADVVAPVADALRAQGTLSGERVLLWALSDLALRDPGSGSPSLTPWAPAFGLPERASWRPEDSFLRARSYSPYNSKRQANDLSRQVIAAGGVICFQVPGGLSATERAALLDRLSRGVGHHRAEGLGQLLADPSLLMAQRPVEAEDWADAPLAERAPRRPAPPPGDLARWLLDRGREDRGREQALSLSAQWSERLKGMPRVSPAQWRRLGATARRAGSLPTLLVDLFGLDGADAKGSKGLLREGVTGQRWSARAGGREAWRWIQDLLRAEAERTSQDEDAGPVLVRALALLADRQARPSREIP